MSKSIIKLLSDKVANQIAAGEVVQRPASVVKELLENSIDADATSIDLIVKQSGKSTIMVIDNGKGMTHYDAKMCFERHATSKIDDINDLYKLTTKGFRGEAMASIAAVSQIEMKTKSNDDELGILIEIEGSKILNSTEIAVTNGTTISVNNLFFNVPVRRKFLKSENSEFKHIINEFERVAIAHPNVNFKLTHNNNLIFNLPESKLGVRLRNIFGKKIEKNFFSFEEKNSIINMYGFIGKPETAKKTREEQFFFVNNRFFRNSYFHKAVVNAYHNIIDPKAIPSYFIFFEVDPEKIDVNIHPTKTEISFEDDKSIFMIITNTIKKVLAQLNISHGLDFDTNIDMFYNNNKDITDMNQPQINYNPNYNPFENSTSKDKSNNSKINPNLDFWNENKNQNNSDINQLYNNIDEITNQIQQDTNYEQSSIELEDEKKIFLFHNKYIFSQIKTGYLIINIQRAEYRIQYDTIVERLKNDRKVSQQLMFPIELQLSIKEKYVVDENIENFNKLGFEIEDNENEKIKILSMPLGLKNDKVANDFKTILNNIINDEGNEEINTTNYIANIMSYNISKQYNKRYTIEELEYIIDKLFSSTNPNYTPNGKKILVKKDLNDLKNEFI